MSEDNSNPMGEQDNIPTINTSDLLNQHLNAPKDLNGEPLPECEDLEVEQKEDEVFPKSTEGFIDQKILDVPEAIKKAKGRCSFINSETILPKNTDITLLEISNTRKVAY